MLIRMAWRNIWRNKTRSSVIITAVILGLWGGIFSDAFMQGMAEQQIYSSIHTETGNIQLNNPGYLQNHDLQINIRNADSILSTIKKLPASQCSFGINQVNSHGIHGIKFCRSDGKWY